MDNVGRMKLLLQALESELDSGDLPTGRGLLSRGLPFTIAQLKTLMYQLEDNNYISYRSSNMMKMTKDPDIIFSKSLYITSDGYSFLVIP